jgi:hypothetical protein
VNGIFAKSKEFRWPHWVIPPRLQYYDVQTLEYRYISKLPMKNERIWSYVKETTIKVNIIKNERDPSLFMSKLLLKFQNILRNTTQVIIRHRVKILFSVIFSPCPSVDKSYVVR